MEKIPLCFIIKWKFIPLYFLKVMIIAGRYRQLYHLGWWYKEERVVQGGEVYSEEEGGPLDVGDLDQDPGDQDHWMWEELPDSECLPWFYQDGEPRLWWTDMLPWFYWEVEPGWSSSHAMSRFTRVKMLKSVYTVYSVYSVYCNVTG